MTELTRLKRAMDSDAELRTQYPRILDGLMTDGEITPEMTSVAAKKPGYSIPAEDFRRETDDFSLSPDDLENVSGAPPTADPWAVCTATASPGRITGYATRKGAARRAEFMTSILREQERSAANAD